MAHTGGYSGNDCVEPMTRAELRSLRTAGDLIKDCHYVLTDYNRGTVGAATIMLHAIDENTLSMHAFVKTAFDTLAWDGRYDIDTNRLENLSDNLGNEVTGNASVDSFPWGVTAVTDNRVDHGTLNYTAGTVTGVQIGKVSTLNMVGGALTETVIDGDSDVTIRSGTNYDNEITGSSVYNQVGTGYLRTSTITDNSTITNGDTPILDSQMQRSVFNTTGSAGTIYYSSFRRFSGNTMQNVAFLRIDSCDFSANSQLAINGATRVDLRYTTMQGYGRVLVTAGKSLTANYTGLRDYSYIQVLDGVLTVNYTTVVGVSYIQHNSTGTNAVDRSAISGSSRVRFLGTSTACRVYYCDIASGSFIEHRGTSTGCYFYYCSVTSSSEMWSNNSVNLRAYYDTATGDSQMYSQNVTGTHYMYYNSMSGHGYIRFYNSAGGRIYAVSCTAQGLLNLVGSTAAGRIYYSSFTAYFYLTANNWTVTRTALHGYGRRSEVIDGATPPANGTYTKNF